MPRYFFHHLVGNRLLRDRIGVELPDPKHRPHTEMDTEGWAKCLGKRIQPGRIVVVTDQAGQVVFVTAV